MSEAGPALVVDGHVVLGQATGPPRYLPLGGLEHPAEARVVRVDRESPPTEDEERLGALRRLQFLPPAPESLAGGGIPLEPVLPFVLLALTDRGRDENDVLYVNFLGLPGEEGTDGGRPLVLGDLEDPAGHGPLRGGLGAPPGGRGSPQEDQLADPEGHRHSGM
ncbi:MAG: uncharacterized protein KVP18_004459 [Porospora cf. gigantea A]|uniref:uncharacterized protein n=1 Tax=Porospora cf. gigantea A TaxID=2853593 RepID=UPI00355A2AA9|nr:MAG: hypothetical protein KVP18_004459 [Porospora cf. gigantea A]